MRKYEKIILVDDNETANFLNKDIVEDGFPNVEVLSFSNSQEFVDYCLSTREIFEIPCLLLLDINMPGKFGFEVLEELEEEIEELDKLDVLMVTSSNLKRDMEASERFERVKGYVVKPLDIKKLKDGLNGLGSMLL